MRFIPTSIKQEGLQKYLDRTADQHDGYDYSRFIKELEKKQNPTALSRMFKVSRNTINKWIKVKSYEDQKLADDKIVDELRDV